MLSNIVGSGEHEMANGFKEQVSLNDLQTFLMELSRQTLERYSNIHKTLSENSQYWLDETREP